MNDSKAPATSLYTSLRSLVPRDDEGAEIIPETNRREKTDDWSTLAIKWLSWFTTLRLFLLRDCREHYVLQHLYTFNWHGYTTILQFSYLLELAICLYQLCHDTNLATNDAWLSTFWNAFVWLCVNSISLAISIHLGTSLAWINLFGFAYDIWHDYHYTNNEIIKIRERRDNLDKSCDAQECKILDKQLAELKYKQIRVTVVAVGIFIGMALFYLNCLTTVPAVVPILGSTLVIFFGVILGNLGNRLFQWDKLAYTGIHVSLKQAIKDELPILWNSLKKFVHEFIRPLSITLYDSVANHLEDPRTAFVALSSFALAQLGCCLALTFCAGVSAYVAAHLLVATCAYLAVTELVTRLGTYLFSLYVNMENLKAIQKAVFPESHYEQDVNHEEVYPSDDQPQLSPQSEQPQADIARETATETYAARFDKLTPKQREILAEAAELNVDELRLLFSSWDHKQTDAPIDTQPVASVAPAPPAMRTPSVTASSRPQALERYRLFSNFQATVSRKLETPPQTCWRRLVPG